MFNRLCPLCQSTITYKEKLTYDRGCKNNTICRSCSHSKISKRSKFVRNCPECSKEIVYAHQIVNGQLMCGNYYNAIKKNSLCKSCAQSGSRHKYFGKTLPVHVIEQKRVLWSGTNNPNYGGFGTDHKNNLSTALQNSSKVKAVAQRKIGVPRSTEVRTKIRLGIIRDFQTKTGSNTPNYNKSACRIFEEINQELGWTGQHAENGGEFYIKDLGYWVDYYEPNLNIVIEYDENRHRRQHNADIDRQLEIERHLECKFYRIQEWKSTNWKEILNEDSPN